jgi:hypothetical protein
VRRESDLAHKTQFTRWKLVSRDIETKKLNLACPVLLAVVLDQRIHHIDSDIGDARSGDRGTHPKVAASEVDHSGDAFFANELSHESAIFVGDGGLGAGT